MTYRLIDELGYEIDQGSKEKIQQSCAMNYGSRIVQSCPSPVTIAGWQEEANRTFSLLVNNQNKSTVVFNPELHTIK